MNHESWQNLNICPNYHKNTRLPDSQHKNKHFAVSITSSCLHILWYSIFFRRNNIFLSFSAPWDAHHHPFCFLHCNLYCLLPLVACYLQRKNKFEILDSLSSFLTNWWLCFKVQFTKMHFCWTVNVSEILVTFSLSCLSTNTLTNQKSLAFGNMPKILSLACVKTPKRFLGGLIQLSAFFCFTGKLL